jgi:hypothetical protein
LYFTECKYGLVECVTLSLVRIIKGTELMVDYC